MEYQIIPLTDNRDKKPFRRQNLFLPIPRLRNRSALQTSSGDAKGDWKKFIKRTSFKHIIFRRDFCGQAQKRKKNACRDERKRNQVQIACNAHALVHITTCSTYALSSTNILLNSLKDNKKHETRRKQKLGNGKNNDRSTGV